jgi:PKD repeat protein
MKSVITLSVCLMGIIFLGSCIKPKEPIVRICPESPITIKTNDTLILENCSEYAEEVRWELPGGAFSEQDKVAFWNTTVGTYTVTLKVRNNDYANFYSVDAVINVEAP